jgi:hypothetical protein
MVLAMQDIAKWLYEGVLEQTDVLQCTFRSTRVFSCRPTLEDANRTLQARVSAAAPVLTAQQSVLHSPHTHTA